MEQAKPKGSNSSLIVIIIVLAILVVVAIGIGAYYYGKSKTGASVTPTPTKTATVSPKASTAKTATPTNNQTTAASEEQSARDFVENFMKMTLGTLPGAALNIDKAHTYLSDTLQAQYSGETWVLQFYGIQDGPDDFQFLAENKTDDGYVLKYNALFGNEVGLWWTFTVVKDNGQWYVNGFSNTAQ